MGGRLNFRWVSFSIRNSYKKPTLRSNGCLRCNLDRYWPGILRASDRFFHSTCALMLFPFTTGSRVSPDLRFIYFVIYSTDTFVIAFWIHDGGWAGSSSRESTRQKKKRKGMPFDKLGRINPRPFILTHGFAFIIFCLVGIAKSIKIYRFFFRVATFHQYTIVYIRFMNFHSIWQGRKKKKKKRKDADADSNKIPEINLRSPHSREVNSQRSQLVLNIWYGCPFRIFLCVITEKSVKNK